MMRILHSFKMRWLLLIVLVICACKNMGNGALLPASYFFDYAENAEFRISPDGKFISYLRVDRGKWKIFIYEPGSSVEFWAASFQQDKIAQYKWIDNEHLLLLKDSAGDEHFHLVKLDVKEKKTADLTPYRGITVEWVEMSNRVEPYFYFGMNKRKKDRIDIYKLDPKTDMITMFIENPGKKQYSQFQTDSAGALRTFFCCEGGYGWVMYRKKDEHDFRPILKADSNALIEPLCVSNNGRFLYASSNRNRDKFAIVKIDQETGKEIGVVYENAEVDVRELRYSRKRDHPGYVTVRKEKRQDTILDKEEFSWLSKLKRMFPGQEVWELGTDDSEDKVLIRTASDLTKGTCYLYTRSKNKLRKIAHLRPEEDTLSMRHMAPVSYKSRDGLLIHAYLTLPAYRKAKKCPFIIIAHDGPFTRNQWAFDAEVQFFANRGYGVLQPNYRGSTGYGKKFMYASYKQWGKKIQDDIDDGARWLVQQKLVDPKKISLYGYGFGGYCALMGAVRKPNIYACSASYSGIINLFDYTESIGTQYVTALEHMSRYLGDPVSNVDYFKEVSPIFQIDRISIPVFMAQGSTYEKVNLQEVKDFIGELSKKGVRGELCIEPNEGKAFRQAECRLDYYEKLEKFISTVLNK